MDKPEFFKQSGESLTSPKLIVQIFSFLIVFVIIYILEAIIPSIVSIKPMLEEMESQNLLDGSKIELSQSMAVANMISASPEVMIPSLLSTVFGTIMSIVYCRNIEVRPLTSMGVRKEKSVPHYFMGFLTGIVMISAITLLSVCFGVNSISVCSGINIGMILLYLLGFFVQGMSEEFIFRGYLLTTVGGYHAVWIAVAVNSVAFSMAHVFNPGFDVLPCINLVLFGVFASFYMICTGDIWGVCGIHSMWNFMQGHFYGISVSGTGDTESVFRTTSQTPHGWLSGGEFGIEGSIFTTLILTAGIAVIFLKMKKDSTKKEL